MSYNMLACSRTYFCRRWESMMLSVIKLTIDAFGANLIFVQCVSLLIYVRIGKSCVTHSTIYEWYQRICKPMSQQNMVETSCGGKNPALCLSQAIFTSLTLITQKRLIFSSYQWSVVSRFCLPILMLGHGKKFLSNSKFSNLAVVTCHSQHWVLLPKIVSSIVTQLPMTTLRTSLWRLKRD